MSHNDARFCEVLVRADLSLSRLVRSYRVPSTQPFRVVRGVNTCLLDGTSAVPVVLDLMTAFALR